MSESKADKSKQTKPALPHPQDADKAETPPETRKRGRPKGKRSNPDYTPVTVYVKSETYKRVKIALLMGEQKQEVSELLETLLSGWLENQKPQKTEEPDYYPTLERDRGRASSLAPDGLTFEPDLNRTALPLEINTLELLEIEQFFGEDKTFTSRDLTEWFERVLCYRSDLKEILKVNISPDSSPIQAAQQLLGTLGLKLEYIDRIRIEGKPIRRYAGVHCNADTRQEYIDRWRERDDRLAGN